MANRSDFNSAYPRFIKRLMALQNFANAHEEGEVRRVWLAAHAYHKRARGRALAARDNVNRSTEADNAD